MEFRKYFGLSESQNMVFQNLRGGNKAMPGGKLTARTTC